MAENQAQGKMHKAVSEHANETKRGIFLFGKKLSLLIVTLGQKGYPYKTSS